MQTTVKVIGYNKAISSNLLGLELVTPKEGTFWDIGILTSDRVTYICEGEGIKRVIGRIRKQRKDRYKWELFSKPIPFGTNQKAQPEVISTGSIHSVTQAMWSMRKAHEHAA